MSFIPSCKDVTEHTSDFVDHKMSVWVRVGYWIHLFICVHCRRYVRNFKLTLAAISRHPDASPPVIDDGDIQDIVKQLHSHAHND